MKFFSLITISAAILALTSAAPIEKRRFGQEHTPRADADFQAMKDISQGTGFEAQLGDLSGAAVRALLAKAGKCDQQDVADQMIDIANQIKAQGKSDSQSKFDALVKVAQDYRTLERNTPKDGQPSELCDVPPRNAQLNGLVQAQDPTGTGTGGTGTGGTGGTGTGGTGGTGTGGTGGTGTGGTGTGGTGTGGTGTGGSGGCDGGTGTGGTGGTGTGGTGGTGTGGTGGADPTSNTGKSASTPGTIITVDNDAFNNPVAGVKPPQIIVNQDGNPSVNGDRFLQQDNAIQRACDVQKNQCFNKFNGGDKSISGQDCEDQHTACPNGTVQFS